MTVNCDDENQSARRIHSFYPWSGPFCAQFAVGGASGATTWMVAYHCLAFGICEMINISI